MWDNTNEELIRPPELKVPKRSCSPVFDSKAFRLQETSLRVEKTQSRL